MASQVQIPFEGVILQEHSAPISCPTPNLENQGTLLNYWNNLNWRFRNPLAMKVSE